MIEVISITQFHVHEPALHYKVDSSHFSPHLMFYKLNNYNIMLQSETQAPSKCCG